MGGEQEPERFRSDGLKPTSMRLIGYLSRDAMVMLDPVGCKLVTYTNDSGSFLYSHDATNAEVWSAMADYEHTVMTGMKYI